MTLLYKSCVKNEGLGPPGIVDSCESRYAPLLDVKVKVVMFPTYEETYRRVAEAVGARTMLRRNKENNMTATFNGKNDGKKRRTQEKRDHHLLLYPTGSMQKKGSDHHYPSQLTFISRTLGILTAGDRPVGRTFGCG
jgi:hypothetical protein